VAALSSVQAFTGTVVDPHGKPLEGARACYLLHGAEGLCVESDAEGRYELPDSEVERIRIFHSGFLPEVRPAATYEDPIVLNHAAVLRARLRDANSKAPIAEGQITVIYLTGRSRGPLPCNAAGVHVKTLWPGEVRIVGRAEGYLHEDPPTVRLEAAEETEVVLDLTPLAQGPPD
jgi:hypothetical protein